MRSGISHPLRLKKRSTWLRSVDMAIDMGAKCITLGNRILRTETAGLAVISIIMFEIDE